MTKVVDAKYYEAAAEDSLASQLVIKARNRIYADFMNLCRPDPSETILDVGVSDVVNDAANVLERSYPYPQQITAVGLGRAEGFKHAFPGIGYKQIKSGERLPFPDKHFSIAMSNAVLEHVGTKSAQRDFVSELMRVSKRVFITVPNRFFPVEHHTAIPVLHWTDFTFKLGCIIFGKQDWARQENLILISKRRLREACPPGSQMDIGSTGILLGPFSSNLYLSVQQNPA
jgi:hypothetical protein